MARKPVRLDWQGDQTVAAVEAAVKKAFGNFGLRVEGYSKKELKKGHGVITSTLRRSIHTAPPGYDWAADDMEPGENAPERGGTVMEAVVIAGKITLLIGSGLRYALPVHQGHHNFQGYHYLTNGLKKAKPELADELKKNGLKR